jgi:predicted ArsR family transcriptional regulator
MSERVAIVGALADNVEGLTVSELVGLLGASDSQVRRTLSALMAAGAVTTLKDDPAGPGRPTLRFRLAQSTGGWPEVVQMLIGMLERIDAVDERTVREAGRAHGAAMALGEFPDGVIEGMARLGFGPRDISTRADERDHARRISFQSCPFRDAVAAPGGHTVCILHHGLIEGMSAALGGHLDLFEIRDPITAGCEMIVRRDRPD